MAMPSPRMSRICEGGRDEMSTPSKMIPSDLTSAGGDGRRRMMARAVTDLPEPDSPTTPSVSLGPSENERRSTARTVPSGVWNKTLRFRTSRSFRPSAITLLIGSAIPHGDQQLGEVHDRGRHGDGLELHEVGSRLGYLCRDIGRMRGVEDPVASLERLSCLLDVLAGDGDQFGRPGEVLHHAPGVGEKLGLNQ